MKNILFIISLITCLHAYTQDVELKWGSQEKVNAMFYEPLVTIGQDSEKNVFNYTTKVKPKGYKKYTYISEIRKYDSNMNFISSSNLDVSLLKLQYNEYEKEDVFMLNDKLYLVIKTKEAKSENEIIYLHEIDKSTFEISLNRKEIGSFPSYPNNNMMTTKLTIRISEDQSKVLFYVRCHPLTIKFVIADKELNLISTFSDGHRPYTKNLDPISITNKGDVFTYYVCHSKEDMEKPYGKQRGEYEAYLILNKFNSNTKIESLLFKDNIDTTYISNIYLDEFNNKIVALGVYKHKDIKLKTIINTGTCVKIYDPNTLEPLIQNCSKFSSGVYNTESEKAKGFFDGFSILNFNLTSNTNKGYIAIYELGDRKPSSTSFGYSTSKGEWSTSTTVYPKSRERILLLNFDQNGEVLWQNHIYKYDEDSPTEYRALSAFSYILMPNGDLFIVTIDPEIGKKIKGYVYYTVSKEGIVSQPKTLFSISKAEECIQLNESYIIGNSEILIHTRGERYGKITIIPKN